MHHCDVDTSCSFIDKFKDVIGHGRALDCGAGIGRVTKHVLMPRFAKIDLIELAQIQIEKAKAYVSLD